jgi:hypothetical protein
MAGLHPQRAIAVDGQAEYRGESAGVVYWLWGTHQNLCQRLVSQTHDGGGVDPEGIGHLATSFSARLGVGRTAAGLTRCGCSSCCSRLDLDSAT